MHEDTILRLEERLAHQEHALQALSDTLYAQQQLLDRLARQYRQLVEQVQGLSAAPEPGGRQHEVPPHY